MPIGPMGPIGPKRGPMEPRANGADEAIGPMEPMGPMRPGVRWGQKVCQLDQWAKGAKGAQWNPGANGADGAIGPMEPMGPGAQQDQWGPMAPLANRISTTTPKSRGRGGSLAYTSLLAWVELNLSLLTSTPPLQQEAIQIETSASVLGIANSVFDRHACAVHLKKKQLQRASRSCAKTGFF